MMKDASYEADVLLDAAERKIETGAKDEVASLLSEVVLKVGKFKYNSSKVRVMASIGACYSKIGEAEKSAESFSKAIEHAAGEGDKQYKNRAIGDIAVAFAEGNDFETALKKVKEIDNVEMLILALREVGVVQAKNKQKLNDRAREALRLIIKDTKP